MAPDFEDPSPAPNFYPYFSDSDPRQESTVTFPGAGGEDFKFEVRVGDPNLGDTLYVRWVSDYPPFAINVSKLLSEGPEGTGLPVVPTAKAPTQLREIPFTTRCEAFARGMQQHRLVVIVADRPFLNAAGMFDDLRYNHVAIRNNPERSPVTYPIVAGWNVICPP